jgi:hypothetical protein
MRTKVLAAVSLLSAITAITAFTSLSCTLDAWENSPYVVSGLKSSIGTREGYYLCAGLEFTFLNASEKAVTEMEMSCALYEADTRKNPFTGSNLVRERFSGNIPSGESRLLMVSLDPYIHTVPGKPYMVDCFTITRIRYSDGSSWEDPVGAFRARSY